MKESYTHIVNDVINRLKTALNADSDASLCKLINIAPPVLSNWRRRNSIDYELIITVCELNKLDLNNIFVGIKEKSVLKEPKTEYTNSVTSLPLIPIDAIAGYGNANSDEAYLESEKYIVPEFKNKADFLIRISGTSMSPKYYNGDVVACKKIPTKTFLQWGKVYVMDTVQGAICKRVLASQKEGYIICHSENTTLYPDFEMPWKEVRSLAIVVGVICLE